MLDHKLTIRISPSDHERLAELARADGRTVSNFVRWVLERYVRGQEEVGEDE